MEIVMMHNLKDNYFVASRGFYGTNSLRYKNSEIEITKYNHDYSAPVTSFDWGNTKKGSELLAYAILDTIATPTVARIYANKYMQQVIAKQTEDEWRLEATEVAQWINSNTNYTIAIEGQKQKQEIDDKESRRIAREEEFKQQVQEKLKNRVKNATTIIENYCQDLQIQKETLAKILDESLETLQKWQDNNEIPKSALKAMEYYKAGRVLKEQNTKLKIDLKEFQEELIKNQTQMRLYQSELTKYKKFINILDIPNLYKNYKDL